MYNVWHCMLVYIYTRTCLNAYTCTHTHCICICVTLPFYELCIHLHFFYFALIHLPQYFPDIQCRQIIAIQLCHNENRWSLVRTLNSGKDIMQPANPALTETQHILNHKIISDHAHTGSVVWLMGLPVWMWGGTGYYSPAVWDAAWPNSPQPSTAPFT